jgi:hypothetical protein
VAAKINRPIESTILDDLGRRYVQAYVLYRLMQPDCDYKYSFGRTYLGGVATLVPGPLWRQRPPTKVKEGTEVLYGAGRYRERPLSSTYEKDRYIGMSSRVFGLSGEAMMNFGPCGVPAAMALFGLFVGRIGHWMKIWRPRDTRRLLLPFLLNVCFTILAGDSDNVVWYLDTLIVVPFLFLFVTSKVRRQAAAVPQPTQAVADQLCLEVAS